MTIGSSFKKQEKEVEVQKKIEEEAVPVKADNSALQKVLAKKGVSYNEFAAGPEEVRKRLLGEDYQETRTKYGWVYDQPIESS